ncbi:MAG: tetratricopeptide repeat protein [Pirellulaceae bacterium]|nr:tetratricopeptide repeat protein [Planctomycetales bacterium]
MTDATFEMAKQRHETGALQEAEELYRRVLADDPSSYRAANNLGTVLQQLGRVDEAIAVYQCAVNTNPDCFLLHYNLAHALHVADQLGSALFHYLRAIELSPHCAETHFNLANLLFEQARYSSAIDAYRRAIELDPDFSKAHSNLGTALYELQEFAEAARYFEAAIEIDEENSDDLYRLARTYSKLHRYEDAIGAFQRSLSVNHENAAAYAALLETYEGLGREFECEQLVRAWQAHLPNDPSLAHWQASHGTAPIPDRASCEFVMAKFDELAIDYDHIMQQVNYRGPEIVMEVLAEYRRPDNALQILDLGCGTGLSAQVLRPFAQSLIGVDLSIGMLERARLRIHYDNLFQQDVLLYLNEHPSSCDVIVAMELLRHFGNAQELCTLLASALRPGGMLVLSADELDSRESGDWMLTRQGTYQHAWDSLGIALQRAGFAVRTLQREKIRQERGGPIPSLLGIAERPIRRA